MAKLHQLLAVDKDAELTYRAILEESRVTFQKKMELFTGHTKNLEMFDESRKAEEAGLGEEKVVTTTIRARLSYHSAAIARYMDVLAQKETTNQSAKADVKIDYTTLLYDAPATLLLALERELKKIREVYLAIPTLPPGITWEEDTSYPIADVFRRKEIRRTQRTEKQIQVISLAKATKEHKEQVTTQNIDKPIGQWTTIEWSGMIPASQKSKIIERIDKLLQAVKIARGEANEAEVQEVSIGKKIMQYINTGVI